MTKTHGFDSKRDAQTKKNVGAKIWDADITDHRNPESLLVVVANGPVEYNASGPTYWGKDVTYRRATREEWAAARAGEIRKMMDATLADDNGRAERRALQAELDSLGVVA